MKYEFIKVDDDNITLKYKDKEFNIKKDIDLLKRLGSIQQKAKIKMMADLKKDGLTVSDLEVERHEGNKTIVDESGLEAVKKEARNLAYYDIINKLFNKIFGKGYMELLTEIGIDLNDQDAVGKFVGELTRILTTGLDDNTPSVNN